MRFLTAVHNNDKIHFQNTLKVNCGSQRNRGEEKKPFGNFVYSYFHKAGNVFWIIISLHTVNETFLCGAGINSGCNLQNAEINK